VRRAQVAPALVAGLVAGALDITYAIVANGLEGRVPLNAVRAVASGILGRAAFDGSAAMAALGFLLHFTIATAWAALYWWLSQRIAWLRERPLLAGPLYGVFVYLAMSYLVVPLSAAPFAIGRTPTSVAKGLAVHILLIGVPIALLVARARRRGAPGPATA
jgi:hypothetical protein